ncbi:MAG: asparaginase [Bacteroidales bacterium]|jgi:L-asparaginase|nr:asparaginase [Bacteroidales bacterium]
MNTNKRRICIIYTGGTIGMIQDEKTGALRPFNFSKISEVIPGLSALNVDVSVAAFDQPLDSSNITPADWIRIASMIEERYSSSDGFVVLHGTDTMSYSASALSFMLENLDKPVIFTGSQLPLGVLRSDGKDNLINSIEIAAAVSESGAPRVSGVSVFFGRKLFRGCRTTKYSAETFDAFISANEPSLAKVGVHIAYRSDAVNGSGLQEPQDRFRVEKNLATNITIIRMHPAVNDKTIETLLNMPHLQGVILETYGSGNAITRPSFLELLQNAVKRGIYIMNVTQCLQGSVEQEKYESGLSLQQAGVISGGDITSEAALTKMMYVLGKNLPREETVKMLLCSLRGEMSYL